MRGLVVFGALGGLTGFVVELVAVWRRAGWLLRLRLHSGVTTHSSKERSLGARFFGRVVGSSTRRLSVAGYGGSGSAGSVRYRMEFISIAQFVEASEIVASSKRPSGSSSRCNFSA